MSRELQIFFHFFQRDFYQYRKHFVDFFINISLIFPALFALSFGLIIPTIGTGKSDPYTSTVMVLGSILWVFFQLPSRNNIELMYDMFSPKFISYQISLLTPWLVLLEKTLFTSLVTFAHMIPFFIVLKLMLGKLFLLERASWLQLGAMIYAGSLLFSTLTLCMVCFVKNHFKLKNVILRGIAPLMQLAGFFGVPWFAMKAFSPTFGIAILANPFIYVVEGIRYAVLQDQQFIHFSICILVLAGMSLILFLLACRFFKIKMDHI